MNTPTIPELKQAFNTREIHNLVRHYLTYRAAAETIRAAVDEVENQILVDFPLYADDIPGRRLRNGARITSFSDLYLCSDQSLWAPLLAESDKRLRAAGIKPADMDADHCPALVAEYELIQITHDLVNAAGAIFEITAEDLLSHGLEDYKKFVEITVGAVVNSPTFEKPRRF